jgi:hypothetical protein
LTGVSICYAFSNICIEKSTICVDERPGGRHGLAVATIKSTLQQSVELHLIYFNFNFNLFHLIKITSKQNKSNSTLRIRNNHIK